MKVDAMLSAKLSLGLVPRFIVHPKIAIGVI